jgi:hypothetical protein
MMRFLYLLGNNIGGIGQIILRGERGSIYRPSQPLRRYLAPCRL